MTDPNAPQPADPNQPSQGQPAQTPPGQPQYGQQPPQYGQQPPQYGQQPPQYGQQPPQYGQQPPQYGQQPSGGAPLSPEDDKMWAMWSHFGGVLSILPSLIIFLVLKDRGPFVRQESKEALNWQITILIVIIGWSILMGILAAVLVGSLIAGGSYTMIGTMSGLFTLLGWLPYILNIVFSIIGGVKVKGGQPYRYPINFRFIK